MLNKQVIKCGVHYEYSYVINKHEGKKFKATGKERVVVPGR